MERLAVAIGLEPGTGAGRVESAAARAALAEEFAQTAGLGVTGYPTLLALHAGRVRVVSLGCRPLADVEAALAPLLTLTDPG